MRFEGTITVQSLVPIGGDANVITAEVVATDVGSRNVFGDYTSIFHLVVDIDAATGALLRGGGDIEQTNADGSMVTWRTCFEGGQVFTRITGGTGRYKHARGWVRGEAVQNADGTISYEDSGWITGIKSGRHARR